MKQDNSSPGNESPGPGHPANKNDIAVFWGNPSICPGCMTETKEALDRGEMCVHCLDELEFGYLSFPSYLLPGYG